MKYVLIIALLALLTWQIIDLIKTIRKKVALKKTALDVNKNSEQIDEKKQDTNPNKGSK